MLQGHLQACAVQGSLQSTRTPTPMPSPHCCAFAPWGHRQRLRVAACWLPWSRCKSPRTCSDSSTKGCSTASVTLGTPQGLSTARGQFLDPRGSRCCSGAAARRTPPFRAWRVLSRLHVEIKQICIKMSWLPFPCCCCPSLLQTSSESWPWMCGPAWLFAAPAYLQLVRALDSC